MQHTVATIPYICQTFHEECIIHLRSLFMSTFMLLNTLRKRQNDRHFADDIFKRIFLKENVRIAIQISLRFVPKSLIDNIPALFQIMASRRPGNKPLSEAMMVSLLTHICVARPQWVNLSLSGDLIVLSEFCHAYHWRYRIFDPNTWCIRVVRVTQYIIDDSG